MKLGSRKCTILSCLFIKLKDGVAFLCVNEFKCCSNKWLANGNQNAILYNVEEYYKYRLHSTGVFVPQIQKKIREAWTLFVDLLPYSSFFNFTKSS